MRFINKMIADTISREQIQPIDMDKHDLSISDLGAGRLPLFAEDNNGNFNLSSEVFGYEMLRNIATICKHYDMDIMRTIIIVQPVGIFMDMEDENQCGWAYQEKDEDGEIVYLYNGDKHIFKYDVGYSHEEQMIPNKIIIEQRVITQ
tara:strand:- start:135 stop:575 length:441 start_codon:yes stop_codon:yes gene_type:complete